MKRPFLKLSGCPCVIFMQISAAISEIYIVLYISANTADNLANKMPRPMF